jgi:hypothetical protein
MSGLATLYGCDEPTVDELIQDLSLEGEREQYDARLALVEIGEPAVEPLIAALNAGDSEIREWAAWCLGEIGDPRAVEPLITMLHNENRYWQATALSSMKKIGAPAVESLVACLKDENDYVRKGAFDALVEIGPPSVGPLIDALEYYNQYDKESAFWALDEIGSPAVEPLITALGNKPFPVQTSAAILLWRRDDPEGNKVSEEFYTRLKALCHGRHDLGVPVPDTIVLLDPSEMSRDVIHPWTYELPPRWTDAPIDNIELIGTIEKDWVTIETRVYGIGGLFGDWELHRKQCQLTINIMEVRTGSTVASMLFKGPLPREFKKSETVTSKGDNDIYGKEVSFQEVLTWLKAYVIK